MATQTNCLNCDAYFADENELFCKFCGQKRNGNLISLRDFTQEIFSNVFSWDSRFWRTLVLLFIKPAKVAKEYSLGRRVRYTNPFRLYFIASIFCFLLQALLLEVNYFSNTIPYTKGLNKPSISTGLLKNTAFINLWNEIAKDSSKKPDEVLEKMGYENTFFRRWLCKHFKSAQDVLRRDNFFERILKKIISITPLVLFLMLPLIALFLKLIYIRGSVHYVQHLVFVFQRQTLCFFLFSVVSLITVFVLNNYFQTLLFYALILFLVHNFLAFKNYYTQSIFKTFVKFLMVNVFIAALSLCALVVTTLFSFFFLE